MVTNSPAYDTRYRYVLKLEMRARYGNICNRCFGTVCGNVDLEFAHIKDTGLKGASRGQSKRMQDVKKHPDHYTLMGSKCHDAYDKEMENKIKNESNSNNQNSQAVRP